MPKHLDLGLLCPKNIVPEVWWFVQMQVCNLNPCCRVLFRKKRLSPGAFLLCKETFSFASHRVYKLTSTTVCLWRTFSTNITRTLKLLYFVFYLFFIPFYYVIYSVLEKAGYSPLGYTSHKVGHSAIPEWLILVVQPPFSYQPNEDVLLFMSLGILNDKSNSSCNSGYIGCHPASFSTQILLWV